MFIARTTPIWSTRQVHVTYNKLLASGQKEDEAFDNCGCLRQACQLCRD